MGRPAASGGRPFEFFRIQALYELVQARWRKLGVTQKEKNKNFWSGGAPDFTKFLGSAVHVFYWLHRW